MRLVRLGASGLNVSAVGLGTWPLGGGYDWGTIHTQTAQEIVLRAWDAGINFFDTAPIYGDGTSEEILGRALSGIRSQVILASKCGLVKNGSWTNHDLRPESIRQQLEGSLARLKTDYLDLYLIHYPDPKVPLADALAELVRLRQAGKIRAIGLCNVSKEQIRQAAQQTEIACVQNEYSLLHPAAGENVFEICRDLNISFIGYGTLCGGLLSGKYTREPNFRRADARNYFYKVARGDGFQTALQTTQRLKKVANGHEWAPASVAGAWALQKADCVLCGAKTSAQVTQNAAAANVYLSAGEISFLEQTSERN